MKRDNCAVKEIELLIVEKLARVMCLVEKEGSIVATFTA